MPIQNLVPQLNPFVGREQELAEIRSLLANPACRLLTLVGPGGIGKSRLAVQAAAGIADEFGDGFYFVSLTPVDTSSFVASAIASALQFPFYGHEEPEQQIIRYLRNKNLLLVLDNFEHLMESAELLSEILNGATGVRILVTSRERLNLREEWVFEVRELTCPATDSETDIEAYDAIQLFLQQAQRVHSAFTLTPRQKPAVIRICRLVGGMPLGIELAAAWVRVLPCEAIAGEIERSMDILESLARNVEDRHRTMRAAFEPVWQRLSTEEGEVFKRLSIFRGGFTREAAEQVAGASLRTLAALLDKCLIRLEPNGRYEMHPLLRQYAEEQLSHNAEEVQRAQDADATYYIQLLKRHELDFVSARQREIVQEVEPEIDNLRAAWQRAVDEENVVLLQQGAFGYNLLSDMQGRYQEAVDAFARAIERLESSEGGINGDEEWEYTMAHLQNEFGSISLRLGRFETSQSALQKSLAIYQRIGRPPPPGIDAEPLANLGLVAVIVGNYNEAVAYGEEALKRISASDKYKLSYAHYVLATALYSQGEPDAAFEHARKAHDISKGMGDKYFTAYILVVMGNIAQVLEDYDQAWDYYRTSYQLKQDVNEFGGMASALNCMARIAWLRQEYPTAKRLFQESYDIYQNVHDPGGLATSLFGLGDTVLAERNFSTARTYFYRALVTAVEIHWTPLILAIVAGVSDFLLKTGEATEATEYLTMVVQHPASDPPTRRRAEQLLKGTGASQAQVEIADLETVGQRLCDQLKLSSAFSVPVDDLLQIKQGATDVLTPREREVAVLIGQGKSNQEIADTLVVGYRTVETHVSHILSKLGFSARTQIALWAIETGLLPDGRPKK